MVAVVKPKFKYDDALDAFGVHGIGGIVGSILTGVFATQYITGEGGVEGALYGDWHQLWVQIVATVVSILFSAVITFVLYKLWIHSSVSASTDGWKKRDLTSMNMENPHTTVKTEKL